MINDDPPVTGPLGHVEQLIVQAARVKLGCQNPCHLFCHVMTFEALASSRLGPFPEISQP